MTDLLDRAATAHGGWDRWRTTRRLDVRARIGGQLWGRKGHAGQLDDIRIAIDTQRQHVEYRPFGGADLHSVYEPDRVAVASEDGRDLQSRTEPRAAFAGHMLNTPWDDLHLAYFSGYAIWNYLTTPFLFRLPGVRTEEIAPWEEDGETWRRLRVHFPRTVATHCDEQVFFFDASGLLRRHDYQAEVTGGPPSTHYTSDPKVFGGLVFPTKRRVFRRGPDDRAIPGDPLVAIDILAVDVVGDDDPHP